ncbi:MAG: hypothetical protein FJX74_25190 [Armatimonadetes bacterium]|nr:hypothetical protein [Armatimonadota bacterium]
MLRALPLAIVALTAFTSTGQGQASGRIRLSSEPEVLPPRAPLTDEVTADVTGTVADALRALLGEAGIDYLAGSPGPAFGKAAEFRVQGVPLWEALDALLEVYGYDWGQRQGVVVCWLALQPPRAREMPPPLARDEHAFPVLRDAAAFALDESCPLPDALVRAAGAGLGAIIADEELRGWHVAGRLAHPSRPRLLAALSGALSAVGDGVGPVSVLHVGSFRRLDEALSLQAAKGNAGQGPDGDATTLRAGLREAVLGRLTAQQWVLVRNGGVAELAFRELPPGVAALFVQAAEETAGVDRRIDWTQPGKASVEVQATRGGRMGADGKPAMAEFLSVRYIVPNTEGGYIGF